MLASRPTLIGLTVLLVCPGCGDGPGRADLVFGQRGLHPGDLIKPRAAAIDTRDGRDLVYVVDFTARIQVFTRDGQYLRGWTTPEFANGRPSGLGIGRDGNLLVADSHYSRVLVYSPEGRLLRQIGGKSGTGPGEFGYVSDVAQDGDGFLYVAEFGDRHRIQKFTEDGRFVKEWGSHGMDPGQFARIRALALGPDGHLYVADSGNHRIQVFDRDGALVCHWGRQGAGSGELNYPYDLAFSPKGDLYVIEYGNHRVQKFSPTGDPRGLWGNPGRDPGCLSSPWALAVDSRGRVFVMDSDNHRVQRVAF